MEYGLMPGRYPAIVKTYSQDMENGQPPNSTLAALIAEIQGHVE